MLGNLSGPTLIVIIALVLIVLAIIATVVIVFAVKRSGAAKAQQAELQRAYEAGLNANQQG